MPEKYKVALAQTGKITYRRLKILTGFFSDFKEIWEANLSDLVQSGLSEKESREFSKIRKEIEVEKDFESYKKLNAEILTISDENYPIRLKEINSPPPFLYVLGRLKPQDNLSLGIVGTRLLTQYGKRVTSKISQGIARSGITIVSGLALGADTLAHKAALENNSRTIAVLGSGLGNIYPYENSKLAREIIEKDLGAVISEFPLFAGPERQNFPLRNRIVAGIAKGLLVTEAPEKSGALITARIAFEQNRDVFAVPGEIFSKKSEGTNLLIKSLNAKLVTKADDILEEFGIEAEEQIKIPKTGMNKKEIDIYEILENQPIHIDDIVRKSKVDAAYISSILSMLEIKGFVKNVGGMMWVRN